MVFRRYIYLLLWGLMPLGALAQHEALEIEEMLLEQLAEDSDENVDISEVMDRLLYYLNKPLNLNTVDEKELADLVFLSPKQIESILYHRHQTGAFISILELQGIRDLDFKTLQLLKLFVEVKPPLIWKDLKPKQIWSEADQLLFLRYGRVLESQRGYHIADSTRSRYLGDPNRYALRYRFNFDNKIRIALNMEKDAGEPFFKNKQRLGFDFYSGHLAVHNVSPTLKLLVLGDYALQFGQGLVAWNGLSFGKGAWVGNIARQGVGLRPYSSLNENNFQRGISATWAYQNFELTPFVGYNKLTASVQVDEDGVNRISSINYSGLHRTPTELRNRQAARQLNYGANINYKYKRLRTGITYLSTHFNGHIVPGPSLYQRFDFAGNKLHQLGLHYNYTYRNIYFFGETAKSFGGGMAHNHGILASLHPKLSALANYRNYQKDYKQFFAQSIGEASKPVNEKGVYSGIVYHPNRRIEWVNYLDIFEFPWLRFQADAPSRGTDFLSQFTYTWYKKGTLKLRYRHRLRQENLLLEGRNENLLTPVLRNQARSEFQYKLNDMWSLRNRIEWTLYNKEKATRSQGWLFYQDVFWRDVRRGLQANIRIAYFNTQDYNSRLYTYESDVLYASSFPMYYDHGMRGYLNIRWRITRQLDLWTRYALTQYFDRETVGSGLDEIMGSKRSEIKFQIRWQW